MNSSEPASTETRRNQGFGRETSFWLKGDGLVEEEEGTTKTVLTKKSYNNGSPDRPSL